MVSLPIVSPPPPPRLRVQVTVSEVSSLRVVNYIKGILKPPDDLTVDHVSIFYLRSILT